MEQGEEAAYEAHPSKEEAEEGSEGEDEVMVDAEEGEQEPEGETEQEGTESGNESGGGMASSQGTSNDGDEHVPLPTQRLRRSARKALVTRLRSVS